LLARRRVAAISRVLRHARRDRPKPPAIFRRSVGPQDAADVLVAVKYIVIVVWPLAVGAAFGGAFQQEHGSA